MSQMLLGWVVTSHENKVSYAFYS